MFNPYNIYTQFFFYNLINYTVVACGRVNQMGRLNRYLKLAGFAAGLVFLTRRSGRNTLPVLVYINRISIAIVIIRIATGRKLFFGLILVIAYLCGLFGYVIPGGAQPF